MDEAIKLLATALPAFAECAASSSAISYLAQVVDDSDSRTHEEDAFVALIADGYSLNGHKRRKKPAKPSNNNNIADLLPKFDDQQFKIHFRLNRSTVDFLMSVMGAELNDDETVRPGRRKLGGEIALLLPIWSLSNKESFKNVCKRFGVSDGHGYRLFRSFFTVLADKVNNFIAWPTGAELNRNLVRFENMTTNGFPNVLGCVGASYIPIRGLKAETESFDIFLCWPGSGADCVWEDSPICQQPLCDFLMVPYIEDGYLTSKQQYYNQKLNASRAVVDNAFGLLKTRFRRLRFLDMIRMELASRVIVSACVLHNICIGKGDYLEEIEADDNLIENVILNEQGDGYLKRNRIADALYMNKYC